jgi:hypothetical protein
MSMKIVKNFPQWIEVPNKPISSQHLWFDATSHS